MQAASRASVSFDQAVLAGRRLRRWRLSMVVIAVLGYGLDQWTKAEAVAHLDPVDPPRVLGGLVTLRLLRNPGAAFSMGSTATVVISLFAIAMLVAVCVWGVPRARHRWSIIACGMLLAGICGNLTDRIFRAPGPLRGHVVDFISLPHFAVFNVADIFITSTAVLVVVVAIFGRHEIDTGVDN
ncbi:signal peptidase II [Cutibacterium sp. WCA-380-WT-3A]|uniref:Lipoprotein signal peptidase n=1 Tax=Cutibacterium porci TaxID=2605781 RepID=A0A7K0J789_9ACTN|nr:signal peptidase II [Cutibacterium porci]MSS45819.1 signal peptidase II [Cutibacterium porci]